MNKKISLGSAVVMVSFAALLTFMITFVNVSHKYNRMLAGAELSDKVILKLSELDKMARELYIGEINNRNILDGIAEGYVKGLGDVYAEYMNAEKYAEHIMGNKGKMVGIGVEVRYSDENGGVIEVVVVMPDSPAVSGGMLAGDYIYKVGGELVSELGYDEAVSRIKGEKGTSVDLTVLRNGEELELFFTRDEIQTQSVKFRMINEDIGYIRINQFNKETPEGFLNAVTELESRGALKYIFDVRFNPGGDLEGVTKTLDMLLPEGPIIRYTRKHGGEEVIPSDENEIAAPMAVLINKYTASAAELFCAALKDYEKAVLIGETTFGKGTMQGVYALSDGVTAFKISNAVYSPPFGECYDGIGVYPHIDVQLPESLLREKSFDDITDEEDTQLSVAVKVLSD